MFTDTRQRRTRQPVLPCSYVGVIDGRHAIAPREAASAPAVPGAKTRSRMFYVFVYEATVEAMRSSSACETNIVAVDLPWRHRDMSRRCSKRTSSASGTPLSLRLPPCRAAAQLLRLLSPRAIRRRLFAIETYVIHRHSRPPEVDSGRSDVAARPDMSTRYSAAEALLMARCS